MNTYIWINYSYFIVLLCTYLSIFAVILHVLAFKISIFGLPNQNWVWGVYIYHKYWDNTRFRQKKLHVYDFQVRLWVAAFLAFLVLKFWKCGKMWPSISKWTYTCQKNLKIQVRKYSAFDLAFLTFVGLFKILLRSLRCKKSGGMQESCTLAFYHQKQFSLKISHFESVCYANFQKMKIPIDPPGFEPGTPRVLCGRAICCATGTKEILAKKFSHLNLCDEAVLNDVF